jgi:O-acetylhomoserine (thiol)-lyase
MSNNYIHPETLVLHGGSYRSDPSTNSVAVPIYQTTAYEFNNTEHAANLFALAEPGNIYTRIMNPTNAVLEERVAALEGGVAALAVASGQSATTLSILNVAQSGDNIVSSTDLYGGTWSLFSNTLKGAGIEVRFADPIDPENFRKLTDDKTRAYFGESLPNPKLKPFPIEEVANIGREFHIPLIVDNTSAPLTCKPLEHGATIVVHSLTKWIGGHGNSIGGIIVDGGNFDWGKDPERQPLFNTPSPSYHGAIFSAFGEVAYISRARVVGLRDLGPALSPFNAYNFIQGLETLPLRIRAHFSNAEKVATFLNNHPKITRVIYPTLHEDEVSKQRASKYLKQGFGSLLGFELAGGKEAGQKFIDALNLFYLVANIGDARSLAIHPATTTHQQLSEEDQLRAGVTPGYIRLSIGIEHIDDILADLEQALEQV